MIWLPYPSYQKSMSALNDVHLNRSYKDLVSLSKSFRPEFGWHLDNVEDLIHYHRLFYEHQDSFYTLGLYCCSEKKARGNSLPANHLPTWTKHWKEYRRSKRLTIHPEWPEEFHSSNRDRLLQLDRDHYGPKFNSEEEFFEEVRIQWPR